MLPGIVSKMSISTIPSGATIHPKTDIVLLTGNTTLVNIMPPFAGFCGAIIFIPLDDDISHSGSGNIYGGTNVGFIEGRANLMVYVASYPRENGQGTWIQAPAGI